MDQDHITLLPTALRWDSNGDLGSEVLRCLLDRLQAQEATPRNQEVTVQGRRQSITEVNSVMLVNSGTTRK